MCPGRGGGVSKLASGSTRSGPREVCGLGHVGDLLCESSPACRPIRNHLSASELKKELGVPADSVFLSSFLSFDGLPSCSWRLVS